MMAFSEYFVLFNDSTQITRNLSLLHGSRKVDKVDKILKKTQNSEYL